MTTRPIDSLPKLLVIPESADSLPQNLVAETPAIIDALETSTIEVPAPVQVASSCTRISAWRIDGSGPWGIRNKGDSALLYFAQKLREGNTNLEHDETWAALDEGVKRGLFTEVDVKRFEREGKTKAAKEALRLYSSNDIARFLYAFNGTTEVAIAWGKENGVYQPGEVELAEQRRERSKVNRALHLIEVGIVPIDDRESNRLIDDALAKKLISQADVDKAKAKGRQSSQDARKDLDL